MSHIKVKSIELTLDDKNVEKLDVEIIKPILEHGNDYIINQDTYLNLNLSKYEGSTSLYIEIEYVSFNKSTTNSIELVSQNIKDWFYEKIENSNSSIQEYEKKLNNHEQFMLEKETMLKKEQDYNSKLSTEISSLKVKHQEQQTVLDQTNLAIKDVMANNQEQVEALKNEMKMILEKEKEIIKNQYELEQQIYIANDYKNKLSKKEQELTLASDNLKNLQELINLKNKELFEKERLIDKLKINSENLSDKLTNLESKSQDKSAPKDNSSELYEKLLAKESQISTLKVQIEQKEEEKASIEQLLQVILNELNARESLIAEKVDAIDANQKQIQELTHYIELKNNTINGKVSEIQNLKNDLNSTLTQSQIHQNELAIQVKQLDTLQSLLQSSEDLIHEQHREINLLKTNVLSLENDYKTVHSSLSFKTGWAVTAPFRWVYNLLSKNQPINQSKTWLWLQFLSSSITQPGAFLKNINAKNIGTLRKALNTEPPTMIVGNLKNLLNDAPPESSHQQEISTISNITPIQTNSTPLESNDSTLNLDDSTPIRRSSLKQKVLFVSPHLPDYDESSGGKRATRMLELLAQECDVYVYTQGNAPLKHIKKLSEVGAIVIRTSDINQLRRRIHHLDAIIFAWYYSIFDYSRLLELYPDAKIIVDSVDVHWVREERSIGIWEGLTPEKVAQNKTYEIDAYKKADIIWTVTENDKQAVLKEIPTADIRVVSNIHTHIKDEYQDSNNNNLLFIGGYNHYPNISAIKLLATEIFPKIRKQVPDATLTIAGSKAPEEVIELGKLPGVIYKGYIEEADMDALYENTFATVSPLLAGAGIKGKICESISYMTPVVTNAIGNEGIDLINLEDGIITDNYDEMSNLIVRALKREFDMTSMTKKAQDKLHDLVGPEIVKQRMLSSILPEVSICIVTWNRLELLKRCIESVEGNTNYPYYKILVHSNGCEDGTQQYLEAASKINPRIVPILSKTNDVFVIPNNKMMMQFPDNDVVLLNNDTYVTPNWLTELYNAAYSSSDIGISGSKILYPDGRLQEFGSELYENGSGKNIGKWDENPNKPEYSKQTFVGYVSGCSMYIKRSTIKQIGVFDEQFHPCYCEDSDYCYTAWENNIQTVVSPRSVIYHDEGGTSGTDTSKGFKKYQEVNFEKFLGKHKVNLGKIADKIKGLN